MSYEEDVECSCGKSEFKGLICFSRIVNKRFFKWNASLGELMLLVTRNGLSMNIKRHW